MKYQRGLSLSGLMMWGIIIGLVSVFAMKVLPHYITFYKLQKDVRVVVNQASAGASVQELRAALSRYFDIDQLDIKQEDINVVSSGGRIEISFDYDKRVPLVHNVSLLIEFSGSASK